MNNIHLITSVDDEITKLDTYYPNSDLSHVYQKHRNQIIDLINTAYDIQTTGILSTKCIEILENGLINSWEVVFYHYAGSYICQLANYFDSAKDLILKLSQDSKYSVRFNIITILDMVESKDVLYNILNNALYDKSNKVRIKAIDLMWQLNISSFLPMLNELILNSTSIELKESMSFYYNLMKDGYHVEKVNDNEISLSVDINKSIISQHFTIEELNKSGINKLASIIKSHNT